MLSFIDLLQHYLCPPGDGVFTVNTAKEHKMALQKQLYGESANVHEAWRDSLHALGSSNDHVAMLGIASDCGGGILRGANWGPLFLRNALLKHHGDIRAFDLGDVRVIPHLLHDKYLNQATQDNCRQALYHNKQNDLSVSPLSITEKVASACYQEHPKIRLFAMGGDHSISYPLVKAFLQDRKARHIRAAIIHFDAHTDLLHERLGIDLCFGSWCTHILDDLHSPEHLIQLGIRSSGKKQSHWEDTFGVRQFWAEQIESQGADFITQQVLSLLHSEKIDELYVSFDIDALDQTYAPATGTPEPGGLNPQQALDILSGLSKEYPIVAADMMEIAPFTNSVGIADAAEITLKSGADISAFLLSAMSS